jgi:hypothetical protein
MQLLFLLLLSCLPTSTEVLDEQEFEDYWWEIEDPKACFMIDTSLNEIAAWHEDELYYLGEYEFEEPNVYHYDIHRVLVVKEGECWRLRTLLRSQLACKCLF